jgi:hypothetical protein
LEGKVITTKAYYEQLLDAVLQSYGHDFIYGFKTAMSMAGFIITDAGKIAEDAALGKQDFPSNLTGKEAAFDRYDSY